MWRSESSFVHSQHNNNMKQQDNFNFDKSKRQIKREAAFEYLVYCVGFLILGGLFAWLMTQLF